jgi:hypothetical protein
MGAPSHVQTTYPTAEIINPTAVILGPTAVTPGPTVVVLDPSVFVLDSSVVILGLDPRIQTPNLRSPRQRPSRHSTWWILASSPRMTEAKGDARFYRRRGGDVTPLTGSNFQRSIGARPRHESISPLEGEMPGRAEGGTPHMRGPTP